MDPQGGTSKGCQVDGVAPVVSPGTITMVGAQAVQHGALVWANGLSELTNGRDPVEAGSEPKHAPTHRSATWLPESAKEEHLPLPAKIGRPGATPTPKKKAAYM